MDYLERKFLISSILFILITVLAPALLPKTSFIRCAFSKVGEFALKLIPKSDKVVELLGALIDLRISKTEARLFSKSFANSLYLRLSAWCSTKDQELFVGSFFGSGGVSPVGLEDELLDVVSGLSKSDIFIRSKE